MPVLITSQRPACRPGIMAENSMRTYSGVRHRRLAIASPSSTRMPLRAPVWSTNCIGGRVGLTDMTRVPFLTSAEAGTGDLQAWAFATPTPRTKRAVADVRAGSSFMVDFLGWRWNEARGGGGMDC